MPSLSLDYSLRKHMTTILLASLGLALDIIIKTLYVFITK